jgi:hypothetical protein
LSDRTPDDYEYRGHLWFAKRPGIGRLMEGMAPEYEAALKGWGREPPFQSYHMFDKAHVVMLTEQGIIPRGDGAEKAKRWARMLNEHRGKEFRLITGGEELTGTTKRFEGWGPARQAGPRTRPCQWVISAMSTESRTLTGARMYKFAELAIGMNPYTRKGMTSLGAPNLAMTVPPFHEIKQSEGTVHTALGDSGGRILEDGETSIVAKLHIDVVSFTPTLYIDGTKYDEDGKLLFDRGWLSARAQQGQFVLRVQLSFHPVVIHPQDANLSQVKHHALVFKVAIPCLVLPAPHCDVEVGLVVYYQSTD